MKKFLMPAKHGLAFLLVFVFSSLFSNAIFSAKQTYASPTEKIKQQAVAPVNYDSVIPIYNQPIENLTSTPHYQFADQYYSVDVQYSDLLGFLLNNKFTPRLNENNALALELSYGKYQNRIGATWGFAITPLQFMKLTAERLSQKLPFNFETGTVRETIPQTAFGAAYEYLLPGKIFNYINLGGYQANAKSKNLDAVTFFSEGSQYIDYRHIAGARSRGVNVGVGMIPWRAGFAQIDLNYDQVKYNQKYHVIDTDVVNNNFGGTINLSQLINKRLRFDVLLSKREIYDDYRVGFSWLPPILQNQIETGFSVERIVSHNSVPDEMNYSLNFKIGLDRFFPYYNMPSMRQGHDLSAWTNVPAVHMARVIATADEIVKKIGLSATGMLPNAGGEGTVVTISGNGFTPETAVTVDTGPAAKTIFIDPHTIIITMPPHLGGGTVQVILTNPMNPPITVPGGFTYLNSPQSPSGLQVSPVRGTEGTVVTITGLNLSNIQSLLFDGLPGTDIQVNNTGTTVTVVAPAHVPGFASIAITTPFGTHMIPHAFEYLPETIISSVSPSQGSLSGGTSVTIQGSGFTDGIMVAFGIEELPCTQINVTSLSTLTCITPPHSAGLVPVKVSNILGSNTLSNGFNYLGLPALSAVSPSSGPSLGNTPITISGAGFISTSQVIIGGVNVPFVVVNDTTITLTTPPHASGSVNIEITNASGLGSKSNAFTYDAAVAGSTLTPTQGSRNGGTSVTITGSGFNGVTGVLFGGTLGTSLVLGSDSSITVVTPSHTPGTFAVVLQSPGGDITVPGAGFTFLPVPNITGLSPAQGSAGTSVTITGTGFTGVTQVTFGNATASCTANGDTSMTCTAPSNNPGSIAIQVTNPSGTGSQNFLYLSPPSVSAALSPNQGITGTQVTITGTGFTGATSVNFGSASQTTLTVTDTQITCLAPANAAGLVTVQVVNPAGMATVPGGFNYLSNPIGQSLNPSQGALGGGTTVIITGTGFTGISAVSFAGNVPATSFTVDSPTMMHVVTPPAQSPGPVTITLSNVSGSVDVATPYTYLAVPVLTSLSSPDFGSAAGGTSITLNGSGFTGVTSVLIGGVSASFFIVNDHMITAITPGGSGLVSVEVSNPSGSSSLPNAFTYLPQPIVTSVVPAMGPSNAATTALINGSGFTGATGVTFDTGQAANFSVINDTTIQCDAPLHAPGQVTVTVSNAVLSGNLVNGFTYLASPAILGVNPNVGTIAGGTQVILAGSGFTGATAVNFGGAPVQSFIVNSDTSISVVTAPVQTAGAVSVEVVNPNGPMSLPNAFTYVTTPQPSSLSPTQGIVGAGVTISGAGLTGVTAVYFGGVLANNLHVMNDGTIVCDAPQNTGIVSVVVTNPLGSVTVPQSFTYIEEPVPLSISPAQGTTSGGTSVTILGSHFTGTTDVKFGNSSASSLIVNDTSITCITPAHAQGNFAVTIMNPAGMATVPNGFTYQASPIPSPTSILPGTGVPAGGASVTISGSGFTGVTSVMFGQNTATCDPITSDNTITCTVPSSNISGIVTVSINNPSSGTGTIPFTYLQIPAPSGVLPAQGITGGGTPIVVSGVGFTGTTGVNIGGNAATNVVVVNDTTINAVTPGGVAGAATVQVVNNVGIGSLPGGYTYVSAAIASPTSILPNKGPTSGGTAVTISGSGFTGTTAVRFGVVNATAVSVVDDNTITCTTPGNAIGVVNITMVNPNGNGQLLNGFQYFAPPLLTNVSPSQGVTSGGTSVTLTGSGFTGATSVQFGSHLATSLTVVSDTSIVCATPANNAGFVTVQVNGPGGSVSVPNGFYYLFSPAPNSISPVQGGANLGTDVTIVGSGFTGVTAVTFGGTQATNLQVVSDTQIICTTPFPGSGTVDVVITNPQGAATITGGFTYIGTPKPSAVLSPAAGPEVGGTLVTITGTGFTGLIVSNLDWCLQRRSQ